MKPAFNISAGRSNRVQGSLMAGLGGLLCGSTAWANPQGLTVASGSASTAATGPQLTISVSDRAVLNWSSFNITPGETTRFLQPNAASIVWNQVLDPNPSHIFGSIQANGIVVLANTAGFWFGPDSVVKAASFVATTASGPAPSLDVGGAWSLTLTPPLASIINYGHIEAAHGGSVFLVAEKIENHGILMAPDGTLGLYAGKEVLISERPDGRGLSATVSLPEGSIDNHGKLIADAGTIALSARVVNQDGLIQANTVREHQGVIELLATDSLTLGAASETLAAGTGTEPASGGRILIRSGSDYSDAPGARISVAGGTAGGAGGQVEISAAHLPSIQAKVDGSARTGWTAGSFLIDPDAISIDAAGTGTTTTGQVGVGNAPTKLSISPSAFTGFSQITLQAKNTIDINTVWTLPDSTGTGAHLTLQAGGDIRFAQNASIAAGAGWNIDLWAGFQFASSTVLSGTGSVLLNGSSTLTTTTGNIAVHAGKDVTVQKGAIRTTGGGSIDVQALSGSINGGTRPDGFQFSSRGTGYDVSATLGGISTAAGGDVTLTAGRDIISFLPTLTGSSTDGGSGAFGAAPGNVTVTAAGSVYGHFVLRNGSGSITAGTSAGEPNRQLALSLVKGTWTVSATDIALQEVRNPNGIFNRIGSPNDPNFHRFDYDTAAAVILNATGTVLLSGAALPRNPGDAVPILLPPSLTISAGAGGILLGNDFSLFPSPIGQLDLSTSAGGGLKSRDPGKTYQLVLSDSGSSKYTFDDGQFGPRDHAAVPVHLNDPTPAKIDISGDVQDVLISSAKAMSVHVGGDFINSGFVGQNIHPTDVTRLVVDGDIRNRNDYTFVTLPAGVPDPDFTLLAAALPAIPGVTFTYDAKTRTLGYRGRLTDDVLNQLLQLQVQHFDAFGSPVVDDFGNPLTFPAQLVPAAVLQSLYTLSQDVPARPPDGFQIGGPGRLEMQARSIDLGATAGILSLGAGANPALAQTESTGADLHIKTTGDLVLFSSAIVSKAGGTLLVEAGGTVEVGSSIVVPVSDQARGIYSSAGSDVTVVATGSVLLNGSRIAAYDGGSVTVRSLTGNVDAGSGGLSLQNIEQVKVDPVTHAVETFSDYIPGSGILATTFSYGSTPVGNITVSTPRGDILARSGGVVQASFNGTPSSTASVHLTAGTKPNGTDPGFAGGIDASKSGVIGGNVSLEATGPVVGVVFATGNININTPQSVNVTALAQGNVNVTAGGTISGTVVGIGSVSASGSAIEASLLSQNVTSSGGSTSGQVGFAAANVAGATAQAASATTSDAKTATASAKNESEDEDRRRNPTRPVLTRTIGRVTVLLPGTIRAQ